MMVLYFSGASTQASGLVTELDRECAPVTYAEITVHHFPDGESKVSVPVPLPECVAILCSLDRPNEKLIELMLAAAAARENGVKRLILVAPYLCYMRQDKAFCAGEAVAQRVIGTLLAATFDAVVTVDPHLHRVHELRQAIPAGKAVALTANGLMSGFMASRTDNPILLGPDEESEQWVEGIAAGSGFDTAVASKERRGDADVSICLPTEISFAGRHVVLVDDVASTGRTLIMAAQAVTAAGAVSVSAMITHALFAGDAWEQLCAAGIEPVWSTDSISHRSNAIALAPLLADGVRQCM